VSTSPFRIVQPWAQDKTRRATIISEHETANEAFREIDRLASEMVRTGTSNESVRLVVVDGRGAVVKRTDAG
jgi:hypothetical protein